MLGVGLGVFAVPTTSHAAFVVHEASGKCITPFRRSTEFGTHLVLHSGDCQRPGEASKELNFRYDANRKRLIHEPTGFCAWAKSINRDNERLALGFCEEYSAEITLLPGGYLQNHRDFGKCIHVQGGGNDAALVWHEGCRQDEGAIAFKIVGKRWGNKNATKLVFTGIGRNRCATSSGSNDTRIAFTDDKNCRSYNPMQHFTMLSNGAIQHNSGKCMHPLGGKIVPDNYTKMVLYDGCNLDRVKFRVLKNGAIQHQTSEKCLTPDSEPWASHYWWLALDNRCGTGRFEFRRAAS